MFKLFLFFITSLVSCNESEKLGEYSQRFSDSVLEQRQCLSLASGLDFIQSSLSASIYQYIRMFNDPLAYKIQRQKSERYEDIIMNNK